MLGRRFRIDRRAYIPDGAAQRLVRMFIEEVPEGASVPDVGTGCGWIATTIACERPDLTVCASDIDPAALSLACENAKRHNVRIDFFESYFASVEASMISRIRSALW